MRFAAYTVFVFVMMVCATIIVVSPHIGLGDYEQFFLYQALGISRGNALPIPLFLIFIAIIYGILSSGVKQQPNQTLVVATIFQLSRDCSRKALAAFRLTISLRNWISRRQTSHSFAIASQPGYIRPRYVVA